MNIPFSNYWSNNREITSVAKLKKAMASNQLELFFLPTVSVEKEHTVELEALLRWPVGNDKYIPPMKFIPMAEQHGLMPELTRWVMDNLIQLIKNWDASGIKIDWSMNLSPRDLQDNSLISDLKTELKNNGIKESRLGIEVSHSIVRTATTEVLDFLLNIRAEGMRLILDNYDLKNSENEKALEEIWNCIKIDRALVMELRANPENIKYMNQFFQQQYLKSITCAPGINSFFEWEKIKPLKCHLAQGFYLSPPQSSHDTQLWLQVSKWGNHTNSHVDSYQTDKSRKAVA